MVRKREHVPGRESRPECGPQGLWKADHVDHGFIALGVASGLLVGIFPTVDCHYLFYFSPIPIDSSIFYSVIEMFVKYLLCA